MNFPISLVTLTHTILGLVPEFKTYPLHKLDEGLSLVVPVYNEEDFLHETLEAAIIEQTERPDQVIISQNGSNDNTPDVISFFLAQYDYSHEGRIKEEGNFVVDKYLSANFPPILLKTHFSQTSKAEGVNTSVPFIDQDWALVIDSDTVLHPDYIKEMKKGRYTIHLGKKKATIQVANNLGGTVLTKIRPRAGLAEKLISMAREAEYTSGQLVIRKGQNKTAMYVTPGCGIVCETSKLYFPDRTVTEDLEMTQEIQLNRVRRTLSKYELTDVLNQEFEVEISPTLKISLDDLLRKKSISEVEVIENTAKYVPTAMMFTQDPTNIKGFLTQIDRWTRGGHQVRLIRGRDFDKNPRVAFTLYGGFFEGLLNSLIFLGLPLASVSYVLTGVGLSPELIAKVYTIDFGLQSAMVVYGMYQRGRQYGLKKEEALGYGLLNTPHNVAVLYASRLVNSAIFLMTYIQTFKEVVIDKKENWLSAWIRPHAKSNGSINVETQKLPHPGENITSSLKRLQLGHEALQAYSIFAETEPSLLSSKDIEELERVYRDVFRGDIEEFVNYLSNPFFKGYHTNIILQNPKDIIRTHVMEFDYVFHQLFLGDTGRFQEYIDLFSGYIHELKESNEDISAYRRIQLAGIFSNHPDAFNSAKLEQKTSIMEY